MIHRLSAPALLTLSFAGLILTGTVLLLLPAAHAGAPVGLVDALFTATSAVCVTGLITLDTATAWSPLGQALLLVLIQCGGLGIVTFSTFHALLLGRRISLAQREVVASSVATLKRKDIVTVVRRILAVTFGLEAVGAAVLWWLWRERFAGVQAAWHAVFHSVSAFCNAGFSTFSTNLLEFRGDWGVNVVVMALVLIGGIGFVVLIDLENHWRYGSRLGLHTRIALSTSAVLVVSGGVLFYLFENGNALAGLTAGEKILACTFASVTPRTAGFNTLDYGTFTAAGLGVTILLMFIGGSPGGCAGGVKTTTIAILFATARAGVGGRERPALFRRSIGEQAVRQTQALMLLAVLLVVTATFFLFVTEGGAVPHARSRLAPVELGFEAVSAFGTVGLSTGLTSRLTSVGKLVLVVLMFVGRVGPLAIVVSVARRKIKGLRYAEENVLVG